MGDCEFCTITHLFFSSTDLEDKTPKNEIQSEMNDFYIKSPDLKDFYIYKARLNLYNKNIECAADLPIACHIHKKQI